MLMRSKLAISVASDVLIHGFSPRRTGSRLRSRRCRRRRGALGHTVAHRHRCDNLLSSRARPTLRVLVDCP